jgi:hypothetical protein
MTSTIVELLWKKCKMWTTEQLLRVKGCIERFKTEPFNWYNGVNNINITASSYVKFSEIATYEIQSGTFYSHLKFVTNGQYTSLSLSLTLRTGLVNNNPVLLGDYQDSGVRRPISSQHLFPMLCPVLSIVSPTLARGLASPGWAPCGGCQKRERERGQAGEVRWNCWNLPENGMLQGVAHVNFQQWNCILTYLCLIYNVVGSVLFILRE